MTVLIYAWVFKIKSESFFVPKVRLLPFIYIRRLKTQKIGNLMEMTVKNASHVYAILTEGDNRILKVF